jgi:hypothetical protein
MGWIDRGNGRAASGATASAYGRLSPGFSDSFLSHSQAMILGGVAPQFLLFDASEARAKRAAMYPRLVLSACSVSAPKRLRAMRRRKER